jgi:sugar lactone lactonase YvrE
MSEMQCVVDAKALLGEGTCWDHEAQCLWWLDILDQRIYRYEPSSGLSEAFTTPEPPGCLAVRQRGGLVVSMDSGFFFFDPNTGLFDPIVDPEADIRETRFNDGRTDRQGRFWASTMFDPPGLAAKKIGSLYRLDPNLSCHRLIEGLSIPNGLAWSPDSRTMYFTDSSGSEIWAWDFDPSSGSIENRRIFADLNFIQGIGDGATVDAEGCYWITVPFKGMVLRYDSAGQLMSTIDLPTDVPTCCEFGGRNLDILYVTTATLRRSVTELAGQSHAGGLWAIDAGVKGLPARPFAG